MRASARDAMTARVKAAFEKWPTFDALPETKAAGRRIPVSSDCDKQQNYVAALYAACGEGVPIGRVFSMAIVVEPVVDDDEELIAKPRGHRLKANAGHARQDGASLGQKSK